MLNHLSLQNNRQLLLITSQNIFLRRGSILIFAIILGLLFGCADNHYAENREILTKDYQSLSDGDLTLYYQQLKDQIEVVERDRNSSSINLGFGMGSYGSSSGRSGSVGVTSSGGYSDVATNLRDRRNDVKLEMKKRNLKP